MGHHAPPRSFPVPTSNPRSSARSPQEWAHSQFLESTTSLAVTTNTSHSSQIFSLSPLWKKRPSTSPARSSRILFPRTESKSPSDKALPPLPDAGLAPSLTRRLLSSAPLQSIDSRKSTTRISMDTYPHKVSNVSQANTTPTSTSALAHAALELGLTPVMPHTATDTPSLASSHSSMIRKAKSSQKLKPTDTPDDAFAINALVASSDHRRMRRLSFGSSNFLNFGELKTRGKDNDTDSAMASPKPLSRKGSFWSRKKAQSHRCTSQSHPAISASDVSCLTPKTPRIPMDSDLASSKGPSTDSQRRSHSRGLSRSLSECSFLSCSPPQDPSQSPPWRGRLHTAAKTRNAAELNDLQQRSRTEKLLPTSRPRAQTNPPLLHRLSFNIFSFATSPPSPNRQYPSTSAAITRSPPVQEPSSRVMASAKPDETPAAYVQRLLSTVSKVEIVGILASSAEPFYTQSLQIYIDRFDFIGDPLDVAMRKLLMNVSLPRETQQIDRVIEAFARQYLHCNPELFTSEDHPYILAFSLIMLHTDVFNKSNRRKMTKADYVRNTKLPGVATEVLECFYDNIVFAPFIFIEDPVEPNGQMSVITPDATQGWISSALSSPSLNTHGTGGNLLKSNKIDPYYLIVHNLLSPLRVDVSSYIPVESPYTYEGTAGPWDIDKLQFVFANADAPVTGGLDQCRESTETTVARSSTEQVADAIGCFSHTPTSSPEARSLKITKIGLLNRKDDVLEDGKKSTSRKWRQWSVLLTSSHLHFFRDLSFASVLLGRPESHYQRSNLPESVVVKPDESLTIRDSIAVYDKSYTKYENTMRFTMSDGRQILLQAPSEKELNEWISRINYASVFHTAQIRGRPRRMSGKMVRLAGIAAATSHLHDIQHRHQLAPVHHWDRDAPANESDAVSDEPTSNSTNQSRHPKMDSQLQDLGIPVAPEVDGADQLKATFDQVKADLAAEYWTSSENPSGGSEDSQVHNSPAIAPFPSRPRRAEAVALPSRAHVIRSRVKVLQDHIALAQLRLDTDLRLVRNIAILTPFQKTTRDRLRTALQVIAKRVIQARLNLVKLLCYHDTLCRDLNSEVRSWGEGKRIALQAAKQTLQKNSHAALSSVASRRDVRKRTDSDCTSSSGHSSSPCGSFHSAVEFGSEWVSASERLTFDSPNYDELPSSPRRNHRSHPSMLATEKDKDNYEARSSFASSAQVSSDMTHPCSNSESAVHEGQAHEQEEAEIWDKTRCAQRVSLVRLPSKLQMGKLLRSSGTTSII
ncbi:hypothetical protein AX17_000160 [Amanita inopinata Kibby_2008]|nr:hypothetical protein AX17_000160 [Amanita inopinata Kibby_2008]